MSPKRCRVLFLLQRPEAWVNLASIHEAMLADVRFQPVVWLLPYNVRDPMQSASKRLAARALLEAERVAFVEWAEGMVPSGEHFDAVVFGHPYDRERPASLSFDRIAAAVPLTVYVPYGLPMGGGRKNLRLQFAQPTQVRSSLVVARSETERALFARHCPSGDTHVQVLGHPRFDRLKRELASPPPGDLTNAIGGRCAILWNAHFSFGLEHSQASNFSTFDLLGPEIFRFALDHRERLCLIWRPHPGLWPALYRNGMLHPEDLPALRGELAANGIVLDERPGHSAAFRASDALVSDVGSFLLEYLVTGKPVLALVNPEGEPLNEEADALVAGYERATSPKETIRFLEQMLDGVARRPEQELIRRHLPYQDGHAGHRVAAAIARLAHLEGPAPTRPPLPADAGVAPRPFVGALASFGPLQPTPVLDRLCAALVELRENKRAESRWRKTGRRAANTVRTALVEWIKLHAGWISRKAPQRRR